MKRKRLLRKKKKSQKQRGGGIVCINTVSSQCRVSFQAFVAAPTMKCVCPQKPYTHSGGFPDLRETERRRKRRRRSKQKECTGQCSLSGRAGQPERRARAREHGLFTGLHSQQGLAKAAKSGQRHFFSTTQPQSRQNHSQLSNATHFYLIFLFLFFFSFFNYIKSLYSHFVLSNKKLGQS